MSLKIKRLDLHEGYNGFVVFENGDGTCYSIVITPDPYGGYICIINNTHVYRIYADSYETKFLCGKKCKYAEKALQQIGSSLI